MCLKEESYLVKIFDKLMKKNLIGKVPQQSQMEQELKAIIQQYMERMTEDRLTP